MVFKYFKSLIFILIMGMLFSPQVGATVLSSGQLNNPYKLAVSNGYLYSVDTANNQVKKFDASGSLVYSYGSFGNGNGQFNQPQGIAVDTNGYIYVVDTGNQRIQKFHDNGSSATFVQAITNIPELSDSTFLFPRSIRADDNGDIFIVDSAKNRVIKYSTGTVIGGGSGGVSAQSVGGSSGIFNAPYGAAIDANDYVFIADTENHKIKKYSSNGNLLLEFGNQGQGQGQFLYPCDVAVDQNGNIYVADTGNHRIQKFDRFGKYQKTFGGLGASADQFFAPRGVFVSDYGYLFVVGANNKIQRFDVSIHITDLRVSDPEISPNADKTKDVTDIKFNLSEKAVVDASIYDSTGLMLVRKLVETQTMEAGENVISWGGADDKGKVVADGVYTLKIKAKSIDGTKDSVPASVNIAVDTTAPIIVVAVPGVTLEHGSGRIIEVAVPYSISEASEIELDITSQKGEAVCLTREVAVAASDDSRFVWDGKDENDNAVKTQKEYLFQISAKDAAGNASVQSGSFITDDVPPEIKNANLSRAVFSPAMNYSAEISFEVSDDIFDPLSNLKVEIRALNDNSLVKKVNDSPSLASGEVIMD